MVLRFHSLVLAILSATVLAISPARAERLAVDISEHVVAITAGFAGSDLLLFGAVEDSADVIVIIRGPSRQEVVRRKARVSGIWINQDYVTFANVPGFYAIASNKPIDELLPGEIQREYEIGTQYLNLTAVESRPPGLGADVFRQALIRNMERQSLYGHDVGQVSFIGKRLFRTDLHFPANVPVGEYLAVIYMVKDGQILSVERTPLSVNKFGVEAGVFGFAHRHSLAYGVIAILIAVMAGWFAGLIFRKA